MSKPKKVFRAQLNKVKRFLLEELAVFHRMWLVMERRPLFSKLLWVHLDRASPRILMFRRARNK